MVQGERALTARAVAGDRAPAVPPRQALRCVAVDWSGARDERDQRNKIWLGEAREGALLRLEGGRDRAELVEHLVEEADRDARLVVGLDFAFALPGWVLDEWAVDAPGLWARAEADGERWLSECVPPFWGRNGVRKPADAEQFRRTEREVRAVRGIVPKSSLQIAGAGHVGTGSVRGMPALKRLRDAGFHVWPFDPPALPLVVEIYPRALTGAVVKTSFADRCEYLRAGFPELPTELAVLAMQSDDAFDAAVSAVVMSRHATELLTLPRVTDRQLRREGVIWEPAGPIATAKGRDTGHGTREESFGLRSAD